MKAILNIFLAAFMLLSVSCVGTADEGPAQMIAAGRTVVFTLSTVQPTAQATRATRAIDDLVGEEGAIDRLDVFFYTDDGSECLFHPDASALAIDDAQKVTITIPEATYDDRLLGKTCTVYIVANSPLGRDALSGLTLDGLKALEVDNAAGRRFNLAAAPDEFFMTGETSVAMLREKSQNLGTVTLERAAAKIVLDISRAAVAGYTAGGARVRLSNYLDRTRLDGSHSFEATAGSADYKSATKTLAADGEGGYLMDTEDALYTYANDWNDDPGKETYLTLEIDWMRQADASVKTYYYRIPFSYVNAEGGAEGHRNRIKRNFVYQFMVDVSQLGGLDPDDAVDLAANFDVVEWSKRTVAVSILSYHYLFVYNSIANIHQRASHEWEYRSSLPVNFTVVDVKCEQYFSDGSSALISYAPGQPQYPMITTREADGRTYFSVSSMIPDNYVPLHVTIKVSNAAHLFNDVKLTIYPKKYVTASYSDGGTNQSAYPLAGAYSSSDGVVGDRDSWGSNNPGVASGDNFNFYRITTSSLDADDEANGVMIGDPTVAVEHPFADVAVYRQTDANANHIISPEFVVASRRGITSQLNWTNARERCARYREAQYPAGSWRVPTFAELAMIGDMQNDQKSAIKSLFVSSAGNGWWTARQAYRIRVDLYTYAGGVGIYQDGTASVRCVHDTWRD